MKYTGTHVCIVTCRSPNGVRRVRFLYHYTAGLPRSVGEAIHRAEARKLAYERQGWRVSVERDVPVHVLAARQRYGAVRPLQVKRRVSP